MERTCILVADRHRARLFEVEPIENRHHRYRLDEKVDLVNVFSSRALKEEDGRGRGSPSRELVAPRQREDMEEGRRFAKEIVDQVRDFGKSQKLDQLIMIACPQFLGTLREHSQTLQHMFAKIQDMPKELSHLSSAELREYLERHEMI